MQSHLYLLFLNNCNIVWAKNKFQEMICEYIIIMILVIVIVIIIIIIIIIRHRHRQWLLTKGWLGPFRLSVYRYKSHLPVYRHYCLCQTFCVDGDNTNDTIS